MTYTFRKNERLCSQKDIDWLFDGSAHVINARLVRIVWKTRPVATPAPPQVLISIPKKRFHHAVDRNRMKRLVREAYRHASHLLTPGSNAEGDDLSPRQLLMAIVSTTSELPTAADVQERITAAFTRLASELQKD